MCVIIHKPQGVIIPEENLSACWENNPDGWGMMWAENGQVLTVKSMEEKSLLSTYRSLQDRELAIHFRWRTHGSKTIDQCHPYKVLSREEHGRDLYVMHNGVIRMTEVDETKSDTWHYVEYMLRPILERDPDLINLHAFQMFIRSTIDGSKLTFLDGDGKFTFVNRSSGHEDLGCWFSNSHSHKPPVYGGYGAYRWRDDENWTDYRGGGTTTLPKNQAVPVGASAGGTAKSNSVSSLFVNRTGEVIAQKPSQYDLADLDEVDDEFEDYDDDLSWSDLIGLSRLEILRIVHDHPGAIADLVHQSVNDG